MRSIFLCKTCPVKIKASPAKNTTIRIIDTPKLGVRWRIPFISIIDRVLYRLYIQSTIKNIKADRKACVALNNIPIVIEFISPQEKTK
mgnify:CR=1 FL=1